MCSAIDHHHVTMSGGQQQRRLLFEIGKINQLRPFLDQALDGCTQVAHQGVGNRSHLLNWSDFRPARLLRSRAIQSAQQDREDSSRVPAWDNRHEYALLTGASVNGYRYSQPILEVGASAAFAGMRFSAPKFLFQYVASDVVSQ